MKIKYFCCTLLITLGVSLLGTASADQTMGYTALEFCDGATHLTTTLQTGQTTYDICMKFNNYNNDPVTFRVDVVEGQMTYGTKVSQACDTAPSGYFGKNTILSGENIVHIPGEGSVEKHALFTVPGTGFAGTVHGCITYQLVTSDTGQGMFSIVSRKANLVDITVPGEMQSNFYLVPIQSIPGNQAIIYEPYGTIIGGDETLNVLYQPSSRLVTTLVGLRNDGYADEEYVASVKVTSLFGLVKNIVTGSAATLYAAQSTSSLLSIGVPRYEGPVSLTWLVDHRPRVASGEALRPRQTLSYTYRLFIIPRRVILYVAILLLLIALIVYRRFIVMLYRYIMTKMRKKKKASSSKAKKTAPSSVKKTTTSTPKKTVVKKVAPKKTTKK